MIGVACRSLRVPFDPRGLLLFFSLVSLLLLGHVPFDSTPLFHQTRVSRPNKGGACASLLSLSLSLSRSLVASFPEAVRLNELDAALFARRRAAWSTRRVRPGDKKRHQVSRNTRPSLRVRFGSKRDVKVTRPLCRSYAFKPLQDRHSVSKRGKKSATPLSRERESSRDAEGLRNGEELDRARFRAVNQEGVRQRHRRRAPFEEEKNGRDSISRTGGLKEKRRALFEKGSFRRRAQESPPRVKTSRTRFGHRTRRGRLRGPETSWTATIAERCSARSRAKSLCCPRARRPCERDRTRNGERYKGLFLRLARRHTERERERERRWIFETNMHQKEGCEPK